MCCYNFPQPHLRVTLEVELTSVYASQSLALFRMLMNSTIIRVGFLWQGLAQDRQLTASIIFVFACVLVFCEGTCRVVVPFVQVPERSHDAGACVYTPARTCDIFDPWLTYWQRGAHNLSLAYRRGKQLNQLSFPALWMQHRWAKLKVWLL